MTAWLQTSWPELARRCWFCGAPRGYMCITAGGNIYGGQYSYRSHAGRGQRRTSHSGRIGHGQYWHCYPHGKTLWEKAMEVER